MSRVLLVTPRFGLHEAYGGEVSVSLLARELRKAGADVRVLAERAADDAPEATVAPLTPAVVARHAADADVVHAYNLDALDATLRGSRRARRPLVATANSYRATCLWGDQTWPDGELCPGCTIPGIRRDYRTRNPLTVARKAPAFLARALVRRRTRSLADCDRIVALSEASRRVLRGAGIPDHRLTVIPNFADPRPLPAARPARAGGILYVGALKHPKGVSTLIEALAGVPAARLDVVGDGPELEPLRALATRIGVHDRVTWHGRLPYERLPDAYLRARVLAFPVWWHEPFGRVVLEAWAHDLPVVTTNRGGPGELVEHGRTGLVAAAQDPEALAAALRRVLEEPTLARRLSDAGRERLADFHADRIVPRYLDLYRSLPAPR